MTYTLFNFWLLVKDIVRKSLIGQYTQLKLAGSQIDGFKKSLQ